MKFAEFLERMIIALTSYFAGKQAGSEEQAQLKSNLDEANLKIKMRENKDEVDTKYADMSDSDVIDAAIKRERAKVPRRK